MATTVTPATIATAIGRVPPPVEADPVWSQWAMWISDAVMLIDARMAAINPDAPPGQIAIDYVVREAVVAHVRRPDSATQVTVTANDASVSKTYQRAQGRVEIIDEWWVLLGLEANTGGAFSIDTAPAVGLSAHPPWCSLYFDSTSVCSCGVSLAGVPIYEPYFDGDC